MKKLFNLIVVLGLILSSNALAGCRDDVEMKWSIKDDRYVRFTFLNNSNNKINVYEYGILNSNNKLIKKNIKSDIEKLGDTPVLSGAYLDKFGRDVLDMNVLDVNTNVIHYAYYKCKYLD
jgi:hypothetical protein